MEMAMTKIDGLKAPDNMERISREGTRS